MKNKKGLIVIIIAAIIVYVVSYLFFGEPYVSGLMIRNPLASLDTLYSIDDELIKDSGEVSEIPSKIDSSNFVAYVTRQGTSSVETVYEIVNINGVLNLYGYTFNSGRSVVYNGGIVHPIDIYNALSKSKYKETDVRKYGLAPLDGGEYSYGTLYYRDGDKVYKVNTQNIFENKRLYLF